MIPCLAELCGNTMISRTLPPASAMVNDAMAKGPRRIYAVETAPLREVDAWLDRFRRFWSHHLDALATEVARGKRKKTGRD